MILYLSATAFFFLTLQSFYLNSFGAAPFVIVGSFLIFFLALKLSNLKVDLHIFKNYIFFLLFIVMLLLFVSFANIILFQRFKSVLSSAVILFSVFSFIFLYHKRLVLAANTLKLVLVFHLIFFYFQVIYWFFSNDYIDYVSIFPGEQSSYLSVKSISLFGEKIPRFTGLYNEPSAYSVWIFTVLGMYYLISPRFDFVYLLSIPSLFISQSMFGILLGCVFIFVFMISIPSKFKLIPSLFFSVGVVALLNIFSSRSELGKVGLEGRLDHLNGITQLDVLLGGSFIGDGCQSNVSVNMLTSFICTGGIFPILLLILVLYFANVFHRFVFSIFVFFILISKMKYTYPLFWIFLTFINLVHSSSKFHDTNFHKSKARS